MVSITLSGKVISYWSHTQDIGLSHNIGPLHDYGPLHVIGPLQDIGPLHVRKT